MTSVGSPTLLLWETIQNVSRYLAVTKAVMRTCISLFQCPCSKPFVSGGYLIIRTTACSALESN